MLKLFGIHLLELEFNHIIGDANLFETYLSYLSKTRQEKVRCSKQEKGQMQELGAGLLLRYALRQVDIEEQTAQYGYLEHGKPYLLDDTNYFFNLSHAGEYVICAISDANVGCDIECIKAIQLNVAKRFYKEEEYEMLLKLDQDIEAQTELFYKIWTFKESYLKMTGSGLGKGLEDIPIAFDKEVHQRWYEEIPGYIAAICCENKKETLPEHVTLIESLTELINL